MAEGDDAARGLASAAKRVTQHNTRVSQIAGKALNQPWAEQFVKAGYKYVFTEIPIATRELVAPLGFPGQAPQPKQWRLSKWVPEGDVVFGNSLDDLAWFDSKAERTSSLTTAQRMSYPKINKNGGIIQWSKSELPVNLVDGKPVGLNNRVIQPGRAHIGYADDLSAVKSGQRDLPSLLAERRGQLRPSPTPYLELEDSRLITDRKLLKKPRSPPTSPTGGAKPPADLSAKPVAAADQAPTSTVRKETAVVKDSSVVGDAAVADTRKAAVATTEKAVATKLTENRLAAPAKDAAARVGQRVAAEEAAETAAKASRGLQFAERGVELTAKVGRVAFVILDFASPIFDLLLAVELVDALVNWLRRDQIREEEEWRNLNEFLLGERHKVLTKYGVEYWTSVRPFVNAFLEVKIAEASYNRNFLYWMERWKSTRTPGSFAGFVYGQIDVDMERQEANSDENPEEPSEPGLLERARMMAAAKVGVAAPVAPPRLRVPKVKYYDADNLRISLTDAPEPNKRVITKAIGWVGPQDKRNRSTEGGPDRTDPDFNISVDISFQNVRFTPPQPTLTPFDFIIVKCRELVSEIVTLISRYEPAILDGMEIRTEIIDPARIFKGEKIYWLEGQTFPKPLNSDDIHFCAKTIFWVVDKLETTAIRDGDFAKVRGQDDRFTRGFYRRLEVVRVLNSREGEPRRAQPLYARRPLNDVASHLLKIAAWVNKGIVADLEYLRDLALSIDDDLVAVYGAMRKSPGSLEYNYQGATRRA